METIALTFRMKQYSTSCSSHICYGKRFYNDFFLNHHTIAKTREKYKQTRNKVKKLLREAELRYWKQEFAKAETSKDFWKVVNKAQGKIKSKVIGTIVNKDSNILTSDKEKAESINEYFTSIGQELASEFSSDNRNNMNFIYRVSPATTRITLSLDKVCAKLRNIKKKNWRDGPNRSP